jgi:hypothetical protein
LDGTGIELVAFADVFCGNASEGDASELAKVYDSGFFVEPGSMWRHVVCKSASRKTISYFVGSKDSFCPEDCRDLGSEKHRANHIEESAIETFCDAVWGGGVGSCCLVKDASALEKRGDDTSEIFGIVGA